MEWILSLFGKWMRTLTCVSHSGYDSQQLINRLICCVEFTDLARFWSHPSCCGAITAFLDHQKLTHPPPCLLRRTTTNNVASLFEVTLDSSNLTDRDKGNSFMFGIAGIKKIPPRGFQHQANIVLITTSGSSWDSQKLANTDGIPWKIVLIRFCGSAEADARVSICAADARVRRERGRNENINQHLLKTWLAA